MGANFRKLLGEVPRPLEVSERDMRGDRDPSRRNISRSEAARRLEPLMGHVATGDVPMDNRTADAVAAYLEQHYHDQHS